MGDSCVLRTLNAYGLYTHSNQSGISRPTTKNAKTCGFVMLPVRPRSFRASHGSNNRPSSVPQAQTTASWVRVIQQRKSERQRERERARYRVGPATSGSEFPREEPTDTAHHPGVLC